jgi:spermidine synthase
MRGAHLDDILRRGKLLERFRTDYQEVAVYDTAEFGRLYSLDGSLMASERDEFFYHENLVHPAAISHPEPHSALIIGGGDGGSAEELFKHPSIEKVTLVELDAGVVAIARKYLEMVHHGAIDDPRLDLHIADGLEYIRSTQEKFDLIVLDLTDPGGGPSEPLYTAEFYAACRARLAPGGALSLHVGSPVAQPQRFRETVHTLRSVFPLLRPYLLCIPLYGTLWGMACVSDSLDPLALDAATVDRILAQRGIAGLQYYNGDTHRAVLAQPNFVRKLLA